MNKDFILSRVSALLAAALAFRVAPRVTEWPAWSVALAVYLAFEGTSWGLVSYRVKRIQRENAEFEQRLAALSLRDAREQALARLQELLLDPKSTHATQTPDNRLHCPSVVEVFGKIGSVITSSGCILELGEVRNGYTVAGTREHGELLLVRNADEALIVAESFPPTTKEEVDAYPSIYHWIVLNA